MFFSKKCYGKGVDPPPCYGKFQDLFFIFVNENFPNQTICVSRLISGLIFVWINAMNIIFVPQLQLAIFANKGNE